MSFLPLIYIMIMLLLHIIPTGQIGIELSRTEVGPIRANQLVHSLVFLPWMFMAVLLKYKETSKKKKSESKKGEVKSIRMQIAERLTLAAQSVSCNIHFFLAWFVLGIVFALSVEGIQYWLPFRIFNPTDAFFNILGVVISAALLTAAAYLARMRTNYLHC